MKYDAKIPHTNPGGLTEPEGAAINSKITNQGMKPAKHP